MESDFVDSNLNAWIDIIFGYKQRGEEAKKSYNMFLPLTYETNVPKCYKNEEEKLSVETQIYQFGQTPSQLLKKPLQSRMPCIAESTMKLYRSKDKPSKNKIIFIQQLPTDTFKYLVIKTDPTSYGEYDDDQIKEVKQNHSMKSNSDVVYITKIELVVNTNDSTLPFKCSNEKEIDIPYFNTKDKSVHGNLSLIHI